MLTDTRFIGAPLALDARTLKWFRVAPVAKRARKQFEPAYRRKFVPVNMTRIRVLFSNPLRSFSWERRVVERASRLVIEREIELVFRENRKTPK